MIIGFLNAIVFISTGIFGFMSGDKNNIFFIPVLDAHHGFWISSPMNNSFFFKIELFV